MGNQQAAFYYSLNYETTNDSGFFDDEVFDESKQQRLNEDSSNNEQDAGFKKIGNKQIPKSKSIEIEKKSSNTTRIKKTRPDDIDEKIEDKLSKLNLAKTRPMPIKKEKHLVSDDHISVNLIRFTKIVKYK